MKFNMRKQHHALAALLTKGKLLLKESSLEVMEEETQWHQTYIYRNFLQIHARTHTHALIHMCVYIYTHTHRETRL